MNNIQKSNEFVSMLLEITAMTFKANCELNPEHKVFMHYDGRSITWVIEYNLGKTAYRRPTMYILSTNTDKENILQILSRAINRFNRVITRDVKHWEEISRQRIHNSCVKYGLTEYHIV